MEHSAKKIAAVLLGPVGNGFLVIISRWSLVKRVNEYTNHHMDTTKCAAYPIAWHQTGEWVLTKISSSSKDPSWLAVTMFATYCDAPSPGPRSRYAATIIACKQWTCDKIRIGRRVLFINHSQEDKINRPQKWDGEDMYMIEGQERKGRQRTLESRRLWKREPSKPGRTNCICKFMGCMGSVTWDVDGHVGGINKRLTASSWNSLSSLMYQSILVNK